MGISLNVISKMSVLTEIIKIIDKIIPTPTISTEGNTSILSTLFISLPPSP